MPKDKHSKNLNWKHEWKLNTLKSSWIAMQCPWHTIPCGLGVTTEDRAELREQQFLSVIRKFKLDMSWRIIVIKVKVWMERGPLWPCDYNGNNLFITQKTRSTESNLSNLIIFFKTKSLRRPNVQQIFIRS